MNDFYGCRETATLPELAVVAITVVVEFLSINSAPLFGGGMNTLHNIPAIKMDNMNKNIANLCRIS